MLPLKEAIFFVQDYSDKIQESVASLSFQPASTVAAHEVTVKGTLFKKNMCVILEKNDEGLVFGRIKLIKIHNATAVYFVTEKCQSVCLVDQGVYCLTESTCFVCTEHSRLLDYYPLPEYSMFGLPVISLHHSFPFL